MTQATTTEPFIIEFASLAEEDILHVEQGAIRLERMHGDPALPLAIQASLRALEATCAAVGFPNMVSLVNRARRMLVAVEHDPGRTFDHRHGEALLAVVDGLRGALRSLREAGQEPETSASLLERLRALTSGDASAAEVRAARLLCWGWGEPAPIDRWVARTAARLAGEGIGGVVARAPGVAVWRLDGERRAINLELARFARGTLGVAVEIGLFVDIDRSRCAPPGVRHVEAAPVPDLPSARGWEIVEWVDAIVGR